MPLVGPGAGQHFSNSGRWLCGLNGSQVIPTQPCGEAQAWGSPSPLENHCFDDGDNVSIAPVEKE